MVSKRSKTVKTPYQTLWEMSKMTFFTVFQCFSVFFGFWQESRGPWGLAWVLETKNPKNTTFLTLFRHFSTIFVKNTTFDHFFDHFRERRARRARCSVCPYSLTGGPEGPGATMTLLTGGPGGPGDPLDLVTGGPGGPGDPMYLVTGGPGGPGMEEMDTRTHTTGTP